MNRVMRWLIPSGVVGAAAGGGVTAHTLGWVPPHVGIWLWPTLVAVILLGLGIFALLQRARLALIPLSVGFVTQIVGLILVLTEVFESPWESLWLTLGTMLLTVLILLAVWGINTIRARILERKLAEGLATGMEGNQEQLGRIRQDMMQALDLLRRAGRGRNAIYELPWFLVMGRPAAGKTVAIKNSGLGLPVKKDWVKGVGGTYTCDWFFTNEMIFLDTPGKWVTEGAEEEAQKYWKKLLQLLRKYRGRRPLDGLVVTVPADDLLSLSEDELREQAANVRGVVDTIHKELSFRFPVYLLVSKTDLVQGFVEFSSALPAQRRQEILGWSTEESSGADVARQIRRGFRQVMRRLHDYRVELLGRVASRTKARRLFFFPEEFAELQEPLSTFADTFFSDDRYTEVPVFRGFYFTSGTQGEGSPLSRGIASFAQSLGLAAPVASEADEETKRSYFLLDLFRELMLRDEGMVGRTAAHWWKRRRSTMIGAFAPAAMALLLLAATLVSFFLNRGVYTGFRDAAPALAQDATLVGLEQGVTAFNGETVLDALSKTEQLRDYHRKMALWSPMRTFGMRRPGALKETAFDAFADRFRGSILQPMLQQAEAQALNSDACTDRIDLLHSVVWMRMGRRFETSNDLAGLDQLWGLDDDEARQARNMLRGQFDWYERHSGDGADSLLPGFSIRKVAQAIKDDCDREGATSTLAMYASFQNQCLQPVREEEILDCYARLRQVMEQKQIDFERFTAHFQAMKRDLEQLQDKEPGATLALEILAPMKLGEVETSTCLVRFETEVVPEMKEYAVRDDVLDGCREVVAGADRIAKYQQRDQFLLTSREAYQDQVETVRQIMADYNFGGCREAIDGFRGLNFDVFDRAINSYLRAACLPTAPVGMGLAGEQAAAATTAAPAAPKPAVRTTPSRPRSRGYTHFNAGRGIAREATPEHIRNAILEWQSRLSSANEGFTASQAAQEQAVVRGEMQTLLATVDGNLRRYLGAVDLKQSGSVDGWLQTLSATDEYAKVLRPVTEVGRVAQQQTVEPFNGMSDALSAAVSVTRFVDEKLPEYQGLLGSIAADLQQCAQNADFFRTYKQDVANAQGGNNLVAARNWVNNFGSAALAGGSLKAVLMRPLDAARGFVQSDNLLKAEWESMVALYRQTIAGKAPLSGNFDDPALDEAALVGFFGPQSGMVARVRQAAAAGGLSPQASAWLDYAEGLSRAMFEPGTDLLRPIPVRLTAGDPGYEPEDLGRRNKVRGLWIHLGGDEDLKHAFEDGDDPSRRVGLPLFADYAFVKGNLQERKGFIKRTIGKNWKEAEFQEAAQQEGAFAALRLLIDGMQGAAASDADLQYRLEGEYKRKPATFLLNARASGEEFGTVMQAARDGFRAPPATIGGN